VRNGAVIDGSWGTVLISPLLERLIRGCKLSLVKLPRKSPATSPLEQRKSGIMRLTAIGIEQDRRRRECRWEK